MIEIDGICDWRGVRPRNTINIIRFIFDEARSAACLLMGRTKRFAKMYDNFREPHIKAKSVHRNHLIRKSVLQLQDLKVKILGSNISEIDEGLPHLVVDRD